MKRKLWELVDLELLLPKGTRDFLPEEMIQRNKIISIIKETFELFGFNPMETPTFERIEVLAAKFAAGTESDALKETFKFKDQGSRELGLKYDLTVPMSRAIGNNPNIRFPFKRYQMEKVFRDGPITSNRYREFLQCDADTIGVSSVIADAEILALAQEIFKKLELKTEIRVNNRKLLNEILEKIRVKEKDKEKALTEIDKLDKIELKEIEKELRKILSEKQLKEIIETISIQGTNKQIIEQLEKKIGSTQGIKETRELLEYCELFETSIKISPMLVRGLAYYTGPIFEVVLLNGKVKSSIAGGGRYDKMISEFAGTQKEFPATGISFGIERIFDEIKEKQKETKQAITQIYVIPIQVSLKEATKIVKKLREIGIKTDFDLMNRNLSRNLEFASKQGMPFVAIIGENELKNKEITLRDMKTGKQEAIKIEKLETLKEKFEALKEKIG